MRMGATPGNIIFALSVMGLGVISLTTGHFAALWQPVPKGLPGRHALAFVNGAIMLLLGAGLLHWRTCARAALALTGYFVLWFVLLHVPVVASAPRSADAWSGFGENGTLIVGGVMLYAFHSFGPERFGPRCMSGARGVRLGRIVFALAALLMSLDNLAYLQVNANFPPAWIPHWIGWGYLVGIAFIAAGLAILCRFLARLAAVLAAWMMSLLTVLCWVSFVVESPGDRINWTGLMVSSALSGAAWLVAQSYRADPWWHLPWHRAQLCRDAATADGVSMGGSP